MRRSPGRVGDVGEVVPADVGSTTRTNNVDESGLPVVPGCQDGGVPLASSPAPAAAPPAPVGPPVSPEAVLDALDPEQRAAAEAVRGPVVVLAGAGTGKTRTITHRAAYAVLTGQVPASALLAVTFTARAA